MAAKNGYCLCAHNGMRCSPVWIFFRFFFNFFNYILHQIHKECLSRWRSQNQIPHAFTRCPTCHFTYVTRANASQPTFEQKLRYYLLVTRDLGLLAAGVIAVIVLMAYFASAVDPTPERPFLHFATFAKADDKELGYTFSGYLRCGLLLFFATIGFFGLCFILVTIFLLHYLLSNCCFVLFFVHLEVSDNTIRSCVVCVACVVFYFYTALTDLSIYI